jgi:riboflavin kinase / FMN adenylyltransferase
LKIHQLYSVDRFLFKKPSVTVGIFDGVHKGHTKIVEVLKNKAHELSGESVVMTLWPHPREVLFQGKEIKLLNTLEEKYNLMGNLGVDHFVVIPFDKSFANLAAFQFIKEILVEKTGVNCLIIGYDNHFGKNKEGDINIIKNAASMLNFNVEHVPAFFEGNERVSSTSIRVFLEMGDIENARKYLGYSYSLTGKVTKGKMLGKSIGFPTANIEPSPIKMVPRIGVYAVFVNTEGKQYLGMLNIGFRPTVEKILLHKSIEVHLIGFEGNLYDKEITITFAKRLRDEKKFGSLTELKSQIEIDKEVTLTYFSGL